MYDIYMSKITEHNGSEKERTPAMNHQYLSFQLVRTSLRRVQEQCNCIETSNTRVSGYDSHLFISEISQTDYGIILSFWSGMESSSGFSAIPPTLSCSNFYDKTIYLLRFLHLCNIPENFNFNVWWSMHYYFSIQKNLKWFDVSCRPLKFRNGKVASANTVLQLKNS